MSQSLPMTPVGKQKLEEEFKYLKTVERPKNIADIEEARAHGDLSENAEYSAAKERQSYIVGRMEEIEDRLARAQVIDPSTIQSDKIVFGALVVLMDAGTGEELTYQIVGEDEADIKQQTISISSPIAKALIGKEEGDEVRVSVPGGVRHFEVVKIQYT